MRVTVGASGHFHRAPSRSSSSSRITGKIGSRPRRRPQMPGTSLSTSASLSSTYRDAETCSYRNNSTKENIRQFNSANGRSASRSQDPLQTDARCSLPAPSSANASDLRTKKRRNMQNLLTRDKNWKGEVPNVILKHLESGERVHLRDLVEGKVAIIDFWLSRTGSNPFTSMDA